MGSKPGSKIQALRQGAGMKENFLNNLIGNQAK